MDYPSEYAALIFDCDGTITDSMPLHFEAWTETLERYGIVFPEDRFYSMGGVPTKQIVETLSKEQSISVDPVAVSLEKEDVFEAKMHTLQPRENVCKIVRECFGKMPMAVASGSQRPNVALQIAHVGLSDMFGCVVTAEDTKRHKPEPDVFLEAARQLTVDPTKCLVFEDAPMGILAAERANMDCIDVTDWTVIKRPG